MRKTGRLALIGAITTSALIIAGVTPAMASETPASSTSDIEIVENVIDVQTTEIVMEFSEASGVEGETKVEVVEGTPESIAIEVVEEGGEEISDSFSIESLDATSPDAFTALVRSDETGETFEVNTDQVQQQALPAIVVALVAAGIKAALKHGTKAALQAAAKKQILALNANSWKHIMQSKHNWSRVTTSKDKIADLMSQAMANGTRTASANHVEFVWKYGKHTIVVRTSTSGHVSNGWIK